MTPKLMRLNVCRPPIFATKGRTVAPAPRTRVSRIHLRAEIAAAAFAVVFLLSTLPTPRAQAQTLTVLYSFSAGTDGTQPHAGLIMDKAGNLYGTTASGGASDYGTVFKLDTTGTEIVLHSFSGVDGQLPLAGLVMDKMGNL